MNFQTILEELDKLYEADEVKTADSLADEKTADEDTESAVEEGLLGGVSNAVGTAVGSFAGTALANKLTEEDEVEEGLLGSAAGTFVGTVAANALTEDEDSEEEPTEEEDAEEQDRVILECSKCGALVIVDGTDIKVDEETDLVNLEDECAFCEEAAGYTIVGAVAPYEVFEVEDDVEPAEEADKELEEGILDKFKKKDNEYGDTTVLAKDLAVGDYIKDPTDKVSDRFYKIKDIEIDQSNVRVKFDSGVTSTFKHNQRITKTTQRAKSEPVAGKMVSVEELSKGDVIIHPKRRGEKIKITKVTRWPEVVEIAYKDDTFNVQYGTKVKKVN